MKCVELLKAIEGTFHRRTAMIGESLSSMIQQVSSALQSRIQSVRSRLGPLVNLNDVQLDVLAAVNLAVDVLHGTATVERKYLLRIALHIIFQMNFFKDFDLDEIKALLRNLEMLTELQQSIKTICSCDFLFWSRELIPQYFARIYKKPENAQKLQYVFTALQDINEPMRKIVHEDSSTFVEQFKAEIERALLEQIIDPLCRDIETDLRLHIHSHLKVADRDPFKQGVRDLARFVKIKPIRFFSKSIDIRARVIHYLDKTFYNLNTVALHDWKTYGEMRKLAEDKYGLSLTETHLPGATLEQGLDVLMIMRNIHIFVARFHYNLNNQIFIERESDSKTLNTITITHIANSIRTHGTGIMNTTVNFTYQFLRSKFAIFSQFLFDDHIKSRLFKDIRFFKQNAEQLDNKYPFERADKFNKEIRKLGVNKSNQSFLDQFRVLITQIGNAMGYIRMIRSGGLYYIANAIRFVPDLNSIPTYTQLLQDQGLSEETNVSAKNLDAAVNNLHKNFNEGTEYFR
jgi:WASH complex subunit 7